LELRAVAEPRHVATEETATPLDETTETLEQLRSSDAAKKDRLIRAKQLTALDLMNKRHAFIANYGGHAVVTDYEPVPDNPTKQRLGIVEISAIRARYANQFVPGSEDNAKPRPLGDWWLKHPKRREYSGMWFDPEGPDVLTFNGALYLNRWQGWSIVPTPGDWSLIRLHIEEVIADHDPGLAEYIIRWCAWMVQNPGKPAEVALVLRGMKGSGKGTLTKVLLRFFGQHGLQISDQEQLTGKFNNHFQNCVLLVADEAYWAGDKRAEGALKRLITEPTLTIEPKFVNAFSVLNRLHLIMTANDTWVVPASGDERRYVVGDISEKRVGDIAYFRALNNQLDSGGTEAMLHDLLNMPLGDWHPREVYVNEALRRQQAQTLRGVIGFYEHILQEGIIPGAEVSRPFRVRFDTLFAYAKKADPFVIGRITEKAFALALDEYGIQPYRNGAVRYRDFPPLPKAREEFAKKMRGGWRWRYEVTEWAAEAQEAAIIARPLDAL
jgi:hypothetical protein